MLNRILAGVLFAGVLSAQMPEASARRAMNEFIDAFNSRDPKRWAATLNYPHVRLASNQVRVYNSPEEFAMESVDYDQRLAPWDHIARRWEIYEDDPSRTGEKVHFCCHLRTVHDAAVES